MMTQYRFRLGFLLLTTLLFGYSAHAYAQNTSGVVGPVVKEGESSLQYRLGIDPENANGETGISQRLHYQRAINSDLRWRLVGGFRKTNASDFDFDYVQAELLWQITEDGETYQTGLRFDARLRDQSRPGQFTVNWANQWALDENWQLRAVAKSAVQIGNNAPKGLSLQTQAQAVRKLPNGRAIGLEMFNSYGTTQHVADFDAQKHEIGPFFSTPITPKVKLSTGVLFGLTKATPDTQLKFSLTQSF